MAKRKQSKKKDLYAEEMSVWLDQEKNRENSCLQQIANNREQIALLKESNRLERKQIKLIRQQISRGEKDLLAHNKKKAKNA